MSGAAPGRGAGVCPMPTASRPRQPIRQTSRFQPPPSKFRMPKTMMLAGRFRAMRSLFPTSRMHELVFGMAHGQHGAGRAANDLLGDAAQKQMGQAGVA